MVVKQVLLFKKGSNAKHIFAQHNAFKVKEN